MDNPSFIYISHTKAHVLKYKTLETGGTGNSIVGGTLAFSRLNEDANDDAEARVIARAGVAFNGL
jgi:hypothetical protein